MNIRPCRKQAKRADTLTYEKKTLSYSILVQFCLNIKYAVGDMSCHGTIDSKEILQ